MKKKNKITTNVKCIFIITAFIILSFIIMAILAILDKTDKIIYVAIPNSIIGGGGIIIILLKEIIKSYKEYKASVLFADLEEYKLPNFKINEQTLRLYQIYTKRTEKGKLISKHCYSLLPSKIRIFNKKDWTTMLYYVPDAIFVNCKNSKHSWWGVCKKFQDKEYIWGLYHRFECYYEDSLKSCSRVERLNNTKIRGAEKSQWDPELGDSIK